MGNRRKQKRSKLERHHILPRSRGGDSSRENLTHILGRDHDYYHALFDNKRPDEIIEYLVNYFWKGQDYWVQKYYDKRELGR